jgi:hypothetical protein
MHDLSADPAYAAEVKRMTMALEAWQWQLGDKLPLHTDKPEPLEFDFSKVPPEKNP